MSPAVFVVATITSCRWLYAPHTVTGLLGIVGIIVYFGFMAPAPPESDAELALDHLRRRGLTCACLVFLGYCAMQLRDSLLIRPHPAIWRIVHGCGLLYLCGLVYLLVFPTEDARRVLRILYPQRLASGEMAPMLPPPHNNKVYAEDCRWEAYR